MAFLQLEYMSKALGRSVTVKALLPSDGFAEDFEPPYKTLYFLPGYSASATQLITYLGLRKQCELKGIAIILPDGENLFYQDMEDRKTFYSEYVGRELVEETRRLLPLSRRREDTFIGGISMGGYGALYNGMKFKETFSKVAALSPAADPYMLMTRNEPVFSQQQFEGIFGDREKYYSGSSNIAKLWCEAGKDSLPELFFCCGTEDKLVWPAVEAFENALSESEVPHVFLKGPGDHEFNYWEGMIDAYFSFLAGINEGTKSKLLASHTNAGGI